MKRHGLALVCAVLLYLCGACAALERHEQRSADSESGSALGHAQRITILGEPMSPLRDDFNAHVDRWRAVLVVSPTCSECVLGAEAVEREILAKYPAAKVHASVVWIPMLESDNEAAARQSTGIIARANASHFYDSAQAVGWAYHRGTFHDMERRAKVALPAGHWLSDAWAEHGEDRPQWDLYMLYAPGVRWSEQGTAPPMPTAWIRHVGRNGEAGASVYWRDTPDTPPLEGDLHVAMRTMAEQTIGPVPVGANMPAIQLLGAPDCPNTPTLRANLKAAVAALGANWTVDDIDQNALREDDIRRGYPTPTILVNGRDLYGLPVPTSPSMSCRMYPDGIPDASDIESVLRARVP